MTRWSISQAPDPLGDADEPIVAELFSVERLEQHAESLAAAQAVTDEPGRGRPVLPRLADNGRYLLDSYRTLAASIRDERTITPAAEWLVDNFHIVEEQVREIRDDLPDTYYRELPKLADGPLAGYPRVLGIAWAYVAHTDSRFDAETLRRMVLAYQRVEPLTIGELWAIAISLRIVLVENLRRSAERIIRGREARQMADDLADRLLGLGTGGARDAARAQPRLADIRLPTAARVQLFQRLRDQDPATTPALGWLEQHVAEEGTTAEETVRREHQRQAEMNVTVRNVITSMRLLSWYDWPSLVESTSLVDATLSSDDRFTTMDFVTRDRYRHAVEALARRSGLTEVEVARRAVEAAGTDRGAGAADVAGEGAGDDRASGGAGTTRGPGADIMMAPGAAAGAGAPGAGSTMAPGAAAAAGAPGAASAGAPSRPPAHPLQLLPARPQPPQPPLPPSPRTRPPRRRTPATSSSVTGVAPSRPRWACPFRSVSGFGGPSARRCGRSSRRSRWRRQ